MLEKLVTLVRTMTCTCKDCEYDPGTINDMAQKTENYDMAQKTLKLPSVGFSRWDLPGVEINGYIAYIIDDS